MGQKQQLDPIPILHYHLTAKKYFSFNFKSNSLLQEDVS